MNKRITADIPDELYEKLVEKLKESGATLSSVIKLLLSEWVTK